MANRHQMIIPETWDFLLQRMSIQLSMGLGPLQTLPSTSKEGQGISEVAFDMAQNEELKALQQQYTSLRDLIVVSSTSRGGALRAQDVEWCDMTDLKFKDKLLKLAARAYLQPIVRESTPQTHFLAQCWITFTSTNKALVVSLIENLQRQADACVKFFRAQTFNLMQRFKPQRVGILQ